MYLDTDIDMYDDPIATIKITFDDFNLPPGVETNLYILLSLLIIL
jgi:hypothetical protein